MCLEFIVKYLLFIVNLAVSLLGLGIIGLGIAVLVSISELNEILPVNVIPISMIVLGAIVFVIGFLACCGAIKESRCMLVFYAIIVAVLAGLKIWLTVVVFSSLSNIQKTVDGWLVSAFNNPDNLYAFHALELSFRCCGTTGPEAYDTPVLPPSCCGNPIVPEGDLAVAQCSQADTYGGCSTMVAEWFATFGGAIGSVLIIIITVEVIAILSALFFCNAIRNKRRSNY